MYASQRHMLPHEVSAESIKILNLNMKTTLKIKITISRPYSLSNKTISRPPQSRETIYLKGQCHKMVVEFRSWITSIGLD
jgi:hypothetical protein